MSIVGALLTAIFGLLGEIYVLKTLTHQVKWCQTSSFLSSECWVKIFDKKAGSMNTRKFLGPNCAWLGVTCPVMSFNPFSKEILIRSGSFRHSLNNLSGLPSAPREVQRVYQLNWGVTWALMRSNIVRKKGCLHVWVLMLGLLDHAGLQMPVQDYYNSDLCH